MHLNHLSAPTLLDVAVILEEVEKDPSLQEIIKLIEEQNLEVPNYIVQQGVLKFEGRLVLSKSSSLLQTIMHTYHDSAFGGHSGFLRTYKRMTSELYWKGMKKDIKKYCDECLICQKNKTSALSPAGLLMPLEIPNANMELFFNGFLILFLSNIIERITKSSYIGKDQQKEKI